MGDVQLWQGDCRELMARIPDGVVDAVITDPPYGIAYVGGTISRASISTTRKRFSEPIAGDDEPFDPTPLFRFPVVALFGAQHYYDRLPSGGTFHIWDKRGDYKPLDFADFDSIWVNRKMPGRTIRHVWRGLCRDSEHSRRFEHPTQKPVAVVSWVLRLLGLTASATILDPYMGSGTTGVAAVRLGCRFIGIECDPRYIPVAERRIEEAATPLFREQLEPF